MKRPTSKNIQSSPGSSPQVVEEPTGSRADKHTATVEPHQSPVAGEVAERAAENALDDSTLTQGDILGQASYRGTEVDIGQQAASSESAGQSARKARNTNRD